jgi:thymidylate synthase (FAD)
MVIFVDQSARIESEFDGESQLRRIERIAKISHASDPCSDISGTKEFVRKLIAWGHESVLEHVSITVDLTTSRGITHQLVRHRLASFLQESTRYVKYDDQIMVVRPTSMMEESCHVHWCKAMQNAESSYRRLLEMGAKPEVARGVLPTDLASRIVITANLREWRHILRLRLDEHAHPDIRVLMRMILQLFKENIDVIFDEFDLE